MTKKQLFSSFILLITAIIWGLAFVAQKNGMQYMGPFTFNALRFPLGGISLLLVVRWLDRNKNKNNISDDSGFFINGKVNKPLFVAGIISGIILFFGSALQQTGIIYTDAGKTAFLTDLYIVLVPVLSLFLKRKIKLNVWIGVLAAIIGLYFLCMTSNAFSLSYGDTIILIGALFWAGHILVIDHFVSRVSPLKLAIIQFFICSILSGFVAVFTETVTLQAIWDCRIPLLYGGLLSVGVAYTLQIVGQINTPPAIASIILSSESLFAVIGGFFLLNEIMSSREIIGSIFMLSGIIVAQIPMDNIKQLFAEKFGHKKGMVK